MDDSCPVSDSSVAPGEKIAAGLGEKLGDKPATAKIWLVLFVCFALLYGLTAQHGPAFQDSGMHQLRALRGEFNNPLGLALAHPLLIAVGQPLKWIFGGARMATALNMVSSVAMAVAVANVFLLGRLLGAGIFGAVVAAVMLGVAHTPWWLATITESYCGVCAGMTTELIVLYHLIKKPAARWLCLLAFVNGLGFSLHNFFLLPLPVYLFVVVWLLTGSKIKITAVAAALACWIIGAGLFLQLIVAELMAGGAFVETIRSALFGMSWQQDVLGVTGGALVKGALYFFLNFPWLSWLFVFCGFGMLLKLSLAKAGDDAASDATSSDSANSVSVDPRFARALLAVAVIEILFGIRYEVPDQFMFLLPGFCLLAAAAALAIDKFTCRPARFAKLGRMAVIASILLTPVLYYVTPAALNASGKSIRPGRVIPFRNENRYWISPWKCGETSAVQFAEKVLSLCGPDSILIPGDTLAPPAAYIQHAWPLRQDVIIAWLGEDRFAPGDKPLRQWDLPEDVNLWFAAAAGRDMYILTTSGSVAPKALTDLSVNTVGEMLYHVPASAAP